MKFTKNNTIGERLIESRKEYNKIMGAEVISLSKQAGPKCQMSVKTCQCYPGFGTGSCGTGTSGGWKYPQVNGVCPSKGDIIEVTGWNPNGPVTAYVRQVNIVTGFGGYPNRTWTLLPDSTPCDGCCANWGGYGGGSGVCWVNCGNTPPCDTSTSSPCATQWWQNPNATWAANWINNRDCSNYTWPANNLETQADAIMAGAPTPQTGPYNNATDIWAAANNSGLVNPQKGQFIGKMAKSKYSQCQKIDCNC